MREKTGIDIGQGPALVGVDHRADVLGTGPVLDCFFLGGTLSADTPVRLSAEHDRHGMFSLDELHGLPLAARRSTLTALHGAARGGGVAYLREGVAP
ncbi:hypothetical protein [Streptomyces sp. Ru62]|uniref:hypothetical protein n=1 Tax=Streptomyces sp. Ru62 TaxID=2080745 RepID=UPI0021563C5F|nr:hypothetical protein [Streptomyces sp. Ru62]